MDLFKTKIKCNYILLLIFLVGTYTMSFANHLSSYSRRMPQLLYEKINEYHQAGKEIDVIAFAPNGEWVLVADDYRFYSNKNYFDNNGLRTRLEQYLGTGREIDAIAFTGNGQWVLVAEDWRYYSNKNTFDNNGLRSLVESKLSQGIDNIAISTTNDYWVVVADNYAYWGGDIPYELKQAIYDTRYGERPVHDINIYENRWFIAAGEWYQSSGIDNEGRRKLYDYRNAGRRIDMVAFASNSGWSVISNGFYSQADDPVGYALENNLDNNGLNIYDRMQSHRVPGLSLALVDKDGIVWSRSYGKREYGTEDYVHKNTRFPAASMSKAIASAGVMRLEQDGDLDPNRNLAYFANTNRNSLFEDWALTFRERDVNDDPRVYNTYPHDLLGHTAGLNQHGIGLYPRDETNFWDSNKVPTLREILFGENPATNTAVKSVRDPDTFFDYSGGGYCVAEALIQAISNESFSSYMNREVLAKLQMTRSTFNNLPSDWRGKYAKGHDINRNVYAVKTCPGKAAGGLVTTAEDYAKFVYMLINDGKNIYQSQFLDKQYVDLMRTARRDKDGNLFKDVDNTDKNGNPQVVRYGMGMYETSGGRAYHGGTQTGYKSYFTLSTSPDNTEAIVVLTNGLAEWNNAVGGKNGGWPLIDEIRRSFWDIYNTPTDIADFEDDTELPKSFILDQNYPNPFNATTTISFDLKQGNHVILNIYDINGRKIQEVINDWKNKGIHKISFSSSLLPSGIYFYRLTAGANTETKRMVLLK